MRGQYVLVVADVGHGPNGWVHVGDEAMFLANVARLRGLGVSVSVLTRSLGGHADLGAEVRRPPPAWRFASMARIARSLVQVELGRRAGRWREPLVEAVARARCVLISGGGNLNSLVGINDLYLRVEVGLIAQRLGVPLVMSGQTIGPITGLRDPFWAGLLMRGARAIGVRDRGYSRAQLERLGVAPSNIVELVDDALQVATEPPTDDLCVVSVHSSRGTLRDASVRASVRAITASSPDLRFEGVPHVFDRAGRYDPAFMQPLVSVYDVRDAGIAAQVDAVRQRSTRAALGVVTRYHAAVFMLGAGRPVLSLVRDEYEHAKHLGLLQSLGLDDLLGRFVVDLRTVSPQVARDRFVELRAQHGALGAVIRERVASANARSEEAWRHLLERALS